MKIPTRQMMLKMVKLTKIKQEDKCEIATPVHVAGVIFLCDRCAKSVERKGADFY